MRLMTYLAEEKIRLENFSRIVSSNPMLKSALKILHKIEGAGNYQAYVVGGSVRDIMLKQNPHDIDIASNIPLDKLGELYKTADIGKSRDFGIVTIQQDGYNFEIANFRQDIYNKTPGGRKPESVQIVGNIEDDLARRDFSVNSLAMDKNGNVLDLHGGLKDIKNKVIRAVGDPKERFGEDYLRIMRSARFSAKLGFDIDKPTKKAAQKLSHNIKNLSYERIRDEIFKAASDGMVFAKYLKILDEIGVLKHIMPELQTLKWLKHAPSHHPEGPLVIDHILSALEVSDIKDPLVNFAIMIHDIGKSVTQDTKEGIPTYYRHAEEGIKLADNIAKRLRLSNKEREAVIFAVANHMKFHKLLEMKPSKIVRLVNSEHWPLLVAVARADEFSRGTMFQHRGQFEKQVEKAMEIARMWEKGSKDKTEKLIDGHRVMRVGNLSPGQKVGKVLSAVEDWIIDNNVRDDAEIDNKIKELAK